MAVNAGIANCKLQIASFDQQFSDYLEKREIQKAADWVWQKIKAADEYIAKEEPFKKIKIDAGAGLKDIHYLLEQLQLIAYHAQPFLPDAAEKILVALKGITLEAIPRLFSRIE